MKWFRKDKPNVDRYARLINEGMAAYREGNFSLAVDCLWRAEVIMEETPTRLTGESYLFIGAANMNLYLRTKEKRFLGEAEGSLLVAHGHTDPSSSRSVYISFNLGKCYYHCNRFQEAEEELLRYVNYLLDYGIDRKEFEEKQLADGYLELGLACYKLGKKLDAIHHWETGGMYDSSNEALATNHKSAIWEYYRETGQPPPPLPIDGKV